MPSAFAQVLFYSIVTFVFFLIGSLITYYFSHHAKKLIIYIVSLAAGIMLGITFFHLIPEANQFFVSFNELMLTLLAGFLLIYLIEHFIVIHECRKGYYESKKFGLLTSVGIAIHNVIDGLLIGVTFAVAVPVGIITSIGILLHKIPTGIITTSLLLDSTLDDRRALKYSLFIPLLTVFGAIVSFLFIKTLSTSVQGFLLALSAGTFLYIAASDLIPETHEKINKFNALLVFIGIFLIYFVTQNFKFLIG